MLLNIVVFIDCCHTLFYIVIYTQWECRTLRLCDFFQCLSFCRWSAPSKQDMQPHLQCMSPIMNRVISPVVVCMSRILFRYLWFMLFLKYEGPRTVQTGWNFNPIAISFLENVPNIVLHSATIIKPAHFQEAILTQQVLYTGLILWISLMPTFIDCVEGLLKVFKSPEADSISP